MRKTTTWIAGVGILGVLLATNPALAHAAREITGADIKDGSITGADIKNHSLKNDDFKAGQLPAGPQGPAGPAGPSGPQGPQGILAVQNFIGDIDTVTGAAPAFVFTGPTTTVTTTATQGVMATSSSALGTSAGSASVLVSECYQASTGGAVNQFGGETNYLSVAIDTTRKIYSYSASVAPGAGSWKVGACVRDQSAQDLDNNDWVSGWVAVFNGTPKTNATATGSSLSRGSH